MVLKEVTEELIQEAMEFLPVDKQKIANNLHDFSKDLKLKIGMRRNLQKAGRGYCIEYSTSNPNRKLFTINTHETYKTKEVDFRIKANLFHVDNYREKVERAPVKIKESIICTENCGKCNPVCYSVKSSYTIDGIFYDPCYIKGHHFENLHSSEWEYLRDLIAEEHKANTTK